MASTCRPFAATFALLFGLQLLLPLPVAAQDPICVHVLLEECPIEDVEQLLDDQLPLVNDLSQQAVALAFATVESTLDLVGDQDPQVVIDLLLDIVANIPTAPEDICITLLIEQCPLRGIEDSIDEQVTILTGLGGEAVAIAMAYVLFALDLVGDTDAQSVVDLIVGVVDNVPTNPEEVCFSLLTDQCPLRGVEEALGEYIEMVQGIGDDGIALIVAYIDFILETVEGVDQGQVLDLVTGLINNIPENPDDICFNLLTEQCPLRGADAQLAEYIELAVATGDDSVRLVVAYIGILIGLVEDPNPQIVLELVLDVINEAPPVAEFEAMASRLLYSTPLPAEVDQVRNAHFCLNGPVSCVGLSDLMGPSENGVPRPVYPRIPLSTSAVSGTLAQAGTTDEELAWTGCSYAEHQHNQDIRVFEGFPRFPDGVFRERSLYSFRQLISDGVAQMNNALLAHSPYGMRMVSSGSREVVIRYQTNATYATTFGRMFSGDSETCGVSRRDTEDGHVIFTQIEVSPLTNWFTGENDPALRMAWERCDDPGPNGEPPSQPGVTPYACGKLWDFGGTVLHELGHVVGIAHPGMVDEGVLGATEGEGPASDRARCESHPQHTGVDQATMCPGGYSGNTNTATENSYGSERRTLDAYDYDSIAIHYSENR